jgi:hypothetical protein
VLLNFDSELDAARANGQHTIQVTTSAPQVRETITITPLPPSEPAAARETRKTDIGKPAEEWTWEDVRNYVVRQIETFHGEFPKDPARIASIFKGFHRRHGAMAGPIAVAAFDVHRGYWRGSPISVTRFCQGSDLYFSEPIKGRLLA